MCVYVVYKGDIYSYVLTTKPVTDTHPHSNICTQTRAYKYSSAGNTGSTGSTGGTGSTGNTGSTGSTGNTGSNGSTGSTGSFPGT